MNAVEEKGITDRLHVAPQARAAAAHDGVWPDPFPVQRYRLVFRVTTALPAAALDGSTLRGVMGNALRRTVCATGLPACDGCPLLARCAYPALFEARPPAGYHHARGDRVPNPFVIDAGVHEADAFAPGREVTVSLTLIGPALDRLELVVSAFRRAFERGVGRRDAGPRGTARLERVELEALGADAAGEGGAVVMDADSRHVRAHARHVRVPECPGALRRVVLEFRSPVRLLRDKRLLTPERLRAVDLLDALVRRQASLCETQLARRIPRAFFTDSHALAGDVRIEQSLRACRWQRYSARQKRSMRGDGLVGTVVLEGELGPFWEVLYLGQYLHVGKLATCGNGAYRLRAG